MKNVHYNNYERDFNIIYEGGISLNKRKLVVLTHGQFGDALIKSAQMIIGSMNDVVFVGLDEEDTPESFTEKVKLELGGISKEILFLVDLYGGTPFHIASYLLKDFKGEIITGLSLPILIESYTQYIQNDNQNVSQLIQTGKDSIRNVNRELILGGNKSE